MPTSRHSCQSHWHWTTQPYLLLINFYFSDSTWAPTCSPFPDPHFCLKCPLTSGGTGMELSSFPNVSSDGIKSVFTTLTNVHLCLSLIVVWCHNSDLDQNHCWALGQDNQTSQCTLRPLYIPSVCFLVWVYSVSPTPDPVPQTSICQSTVRTNFNAYNFECLLWSWCGVWGFLWKVPPGLEVLRGSLLYVGINSLTPRNFPLWALSVLSIWCCSSHGNFLRQLKLLLLEPLLSICITTMTLIVPSTFFLTSEALIKTLKLKWLVWGSRDIPELVHLREVLEQKRMKILGAQWFTYFTWHEEPEKTTKQFKLHSNCRCF